MGRLEGKIALVTGSGSGIGKAIAIMYAREGAKVVCVNSNEGRGQATLKAIQDAGGEGIFVQCDVRKKEDIQRAVKTAVDTYGTLTTLVNAAGVLVHAHFLDHTDEDYRKIDETNFRAYYWMMQECLPILVKNGHASVVNVASISVMKPESDAYIYGAFKAAINKMTRDLIREFTPQGVRLNVICPGPVNTNMTPAEVKNSPEAQKALVAEVCPCGRIGDPDDIAYGAVYLASEEAAWVTGTTLVIDGGACNMG